MLISRVFSGEKRAAWRVRADERAVPTTELVVMLRHPCHFVPSESLRVAGSVPVAFRVSGIALERFSVTFRVSGIAAERFQ